MAKTQNSNLDVTDTLAAIIAVAERHENVVKARIKRAKAEANARSDKMFSAADQPEGLAHHQQSELMDKSDDIRIQSDHVAAKALARLNKDASALANMLIENYTTANTAFHEADNDLSQFISGVKKIRAQKGRFVPEDMVTRQQNALEAAKSKTLDERRKAFGIMRSKIKHVRNRRMEYRDFEKAGRIQTGKVFWNTFSRMMKSSGMIDIINEAEERRAKAQARAKQAQESNQRSTQRQGETRVTIADVINGGK